MIRPHIARACLAITFAIFWPLVIIAKRLCELAGEPGHDLSYWERRR